MGVVGAGEEVALPAAVPPVAGTSVGVAVVVVAALRTVARPAVGIGKAIAPAGRKAAKPPRKDGRKAAKPQRKDGRKAAKPPRKDGRKAGRTGPMTTMVPAVAMEGIIVPLGPMRPGLSLVRSLVRRSRLPRLVPWRSPRPLWWWAASPIINPDRPGTNLCIKEAR